MSPKCASQLACNSEIQQRSSSVRMPRGVCLQRREAAHRDVQAFCEALEKGNPQAPTNSHRANARNSIFAGRKKGTKRQHKATEFFTRRMRRSLSRVKSYRYRRQPNALGTRLPLAPICQPGIAVCFDPFAPSAHCSVRDSQDFCRRPPRNLLGHRLQQHILNLHHPLHLGGWVLLGFVHYPALPAPTKADRSRVNSTGQLTY